MTVDDFVKEHLAENEVYARKYAPENGTPPVFFVLAIPKGMVLGPGLVRSIAGDVVASLVQAAHGE